ncbi:MAG: tripartite tricarboxylate transporter substrate binding protein [Polynucleobacter sp.]|jgi:tripartite-type tricarboxylate transporter receptor subunit TctC|nr:tripartite tricarboxylate transporter substrate binding protein [Polynucleobacter sp.]
MKNRNGVYFVISFLCVSFGLTNSFAQSLPGDYPAKAINMVIPFPPGGPTDVTGRVLAEKLTLALGQSVVVDNKPGASGNIAAQLVARAPADGYTIFFTTGGTQAINPFLYKNIGYDPVKDFEPVVWVTTSPNIIVVNPDFPAKNLQELIDMAKAKPGFYSSAAPGQGSTPHMAGELFKRQAGINMTHIPYKGSGPALNDVMGGHVQIMFDGIPSSLPLVRSGKLRALAVTSKNRSASAPDIPTVSETIPGFEATGWFAIYVPAKTPKEIILKLNQEVNRILEMPDVKKRYADLGADVVGGSPEKLREQVQKESIKWSELIRVNGIKAE